MTGARIFVAVAYLILGIFVTANTDLHTRRRAEAVQPLGFLEKPLTEHRLRAGLRDVGHRG